MAIKELITIEGAEEVKKTIADLGKSGEDFIKKLNTVGTSGNSGLQSFFTQIKTGTSAFNEHTHSVGTVSAAYHILNPLLHEAGATIVGFREWAMVARLGFIGLATAGVGAAITALFKFAEAGESAKQSIQNVLGEQKGNVLFKGLVDSAGKANTTVDGLAASAKILAQAWSTTPVITGWVREFNTQLDQYGNIIKEDLQGTLVPTGFTTAAKSMADIPNVLTTISKGLQAEGMSADDANKATATFLANITKVGVVDLSKIPQMAGQLSQGFTKALDFQGLSLDLLQQFEQTAPLFSKILEQKLTGGFASVQERIANEGNISANEVIKAIVDIGPQVDSAAAKIPRTLGQTTDDMVAAIQRATQSVAPALEQSTIQGVQSMESVMVQNKVPQIVEQQWSGIWANIVSGAQEAYNKIVNIFSNPIRVDVQTQGGGGVPPFATGGLFRGRGGIDNNIIAVSDYEYILRPEAVKKYGVQLLDWINSLQMPVRGFASGGLVTPRPALAGGRLPSNNQRPFVLNIPGAGSFRGSIAAPDGVLESLSRASTFEQMTQGGRSPGWRR